MNDDNTVSRPTNLATLHLRFRPLLSSELKIDLFVLSRH